MTAAELFLHLSSNSNGTSIWGGTVMADRRRGESKELKKDQTVRREVLDEIGAEITQAHTEATYRNANRDQARGDWDRSRRHTDEERSRDEEKDGDDGLGPKSR
jgi:hypothetical protein